MILNKDQAERFLNSIVVLYNNCNSDTLNQNLTSIFLSGNLDFTDSKDALKIFYSETEAIGLSGLTTLLIDGEEVMIDTIDEILQDCDLSSQWSLNFSNNNCNADSLLAEHIHFFLDIDSVKKVLDNINPLDYDQLFNEGDKYKLLLPTEMEPLTTPSLIVTGVERFSSDFSTNGKNSINLKKIKNNIQFDSNRKLFLDCEYFSYESCPKELILTMNRLQATQYATSLASKIINSEEVSLEGLIQKELAVSNKNESITSEKLEQVRSLCEWVFEGLVSTRKRLVQDILLLNVRENETLVSCLLRESKKCLDRAVSQFNYVLEERRHDYFKELTAVNSELSKQSDHYNSKLRSIITSISRDFLASIFLMGVTIPIRLSRVSSDYSVSTDMFLIYLIEVIGAYLLVSLVLQVLSTIPDIVKSKKQIESWVNSTRLNILVDDFDNHFKNPLSEKTRFFYFQYGIVAILYLILGIYLVSSPEHVLNLWQV